MKESDHPDKVIEHKLTGCPKCYINLEDHHLYWKKAQIFDIPDLRVEIEEHLFQECYCLIVSKATVQIYRKEYS